MSLAAEQPHVAALCKDSSRWLLPPETHASLLEAWHGGRAFWDGVGVHGQHVSIKLGDIVGVMLWTEDAIANAEADAEAEHARDLLDNT